MKISKYKRWLVGFAMLLAGTMAHADGTPFAYNAAGVGDPSFPLFLGTNDTITVTKNGSGANTYWTLTGTGTSSSLQTSYGGVLGALLGFSTGYNLGNETVKYVANFNSAGKLITSIGNTVLSNFLEIKGSLPAGRNGGTTWSAIPKQLLLSAKLLDVNPGNNAPDLVGTFGGLAVGFKTQFTGGWAAQNTRLTGGSSGENLWLAGLSSGFLNLVKALDSSTSNGTLSSLFSRRTTISGVVSIASVPVPAAVWLFGTGLMSLLAGRRKSAAAVGLAA